MKGFKKITVWLDAEYKKTKIIYLPSEYTKQQVTSACNVQFGSNGWCFYDID